MNAVNPLKPFKEFMPFAPKWLRITLYTLRVLLLMLPSLCAPSLTSCIGAETHITTNVDGIGVGVATENAGSIDIPSCDGTTEEAFREDNYLPEDNVELISYHQLGKLCF